MDDIKAITNLETASIKRAARRGKLTRQTNKLEMFMSQPLHEQNTGKFSKLNQDFAKEKRLHEALQTRCEQLLEARKGTTRDHLLKEIESAEEVSEGYEDTLHLAEQTKEKLDLYLESQSLQRECRTLMEILDPSVGEFEKDSCKIQRKLALFVNTTASHEVPEVVEIRELFRNHAIGFSADISKMFREIKLHEDEKDLHRFLWKNEDGNIKDMRMRRLTFGV